MGDLSVVPYNLELCYGLANKSSARETMLWLFDDVAKYDYVNKAKADPQFQRRYSGGSHVRLALIEPREYEARIVSWFLRTLGSRPNMTNWLPHARRLRAALHHLPERHRFNDGSQPGRANPFAWMDALAASMRRRRRLAAAGIGGSVDAEAAMVHAELEAIATAGGFLRPR